MERSFFGASDLGASALGASALGASALALGRPRLGPGAEDAKECRALNRVIRWC